MSKLIIIDGNAILHRAYHALPPLSTSSGQPINAVYGFLTMLFKIRDDLHPTHLIVCFDRPEPTFRKQMYVGYQAQRPRMEGELSSQIDLIKEVVTEMKIPIFELAGYEADDIIGTLAYQARNSKQLSVNSKPSDSEGKQEKIDEIIIVTGDRDILQLVDDKTKVYMPIQGLSLAKLYGEAEVEEKFGIKSSQIVDYKALVGDHSDNYPGVRGIGPKTASTLLQKYQTLEKIYEAIEKKDKNGISEKVAKALSEEVNEANMAKKLAKIDTQVPVTLKPDEASSFNFETDEVKEVFIKYEFHSLLKRLVSGKKEPEKPKKKESDQLSFI